VRIAATADAGMIFGAARPGTAAVVILGDALTGHVNPLLVLVSICTAM